MPRRSRIDAPRALHHIIVRGNERREIFKDDRDRDMFLQRMGAILKETQTDCFAWSLMSNHFHLLLRTGHAPVSRVMQRLLTGYAVNFNRRHHRSGHLFQNRYKSILCQEDPYFLELVRYIHLNPLRAGLVEAVEELDAYPFAGHSVIMGKRKREWQDKHAVLLRFGRRMGVARKEYRDFVARGVDQGKRDDLVGGGLIRSLGGWSAVKALRRSNTLIKGDERILGDGDFVNDTLQKCREAYEERFKLRSQGWGVDKVAERVAQLFNMDVDELWLPGRYRQLVAARSLFCYWCVRELGASMASLAKRLNISPAAISKSVVRGADLIEKNGYTLNGK